MFTVIEIGTGKAFAVYGMNGTNFLIYDELGWGYKHINNFRPATIDETLRQRIAALEVERDELLIVIRNYGECDACKHAELDADEEPCNNCRGTGGPQDKWEWRGVRNKEVTKDA